VCITASGAGRAVTRSGLCRRSRASISWTPWSISPTAIALNLFGRDRGHRVRVRTELDFTNCSMHRPHSVRRICGNPQRRHPCVSTSSRAEYLKQLQLRSAWGTHPAVAKGSAIARNPRDSRRRSSSRHNSLRAVAPTFFVVDSCFPSSIALIA